MTNHMPLVVRLARRFASGRFARRASYCAAAVSAAVMALFVTMIGFDQTGQQIVQQTLGKYDYSADLGGAAPLGPGRSGPETLPGQLAAAGASESTVVLQTFDVRSVRAESVFTVFLEGDWSNSPFPDRYALTTGRWPSAPGEVVATAAYLRASGTGSLPAATQVLSGNAELNVVGEIHDRFSTESARLLAGPGTWAALDESALSERFPNLTASPTVLWSGGEASEVASAIEDAYLAGAASMSPDPTAGEPPAFSVSNRDRILSRERNSYVSDIPLAYTVPSIALPVGAALFAFGLNGRRLRRNLATLRAVGISRRDATVGVGLATVFWLTVGALVGSVIGIPVGLAARWVASHYVTRPLGPPQGVLQAGTRTLLLTFVTGLVVVAIAARSRRSTTITADLGGAPSPRRAAPQLQRAGLVSAFAALLMQVALVATIPGAMTFTLTLLVLVVLLTGSVLPKILQLLPGDGPRSRLVRRQLLADRTRVLTATAIITAVFAVALSMVIFLDAMSVSEAKTRVTAAAPGQLNIVAGGGGLSSAPSPALVTTVREALGESPQPIDVGFVFGNDEIARLDGVSDGIVLVVDSASEVARLGGRRLSDSSETVLNSGGVLTWEGPTTDKIRLIVSNFADGTTLRTTAPVPTATIPFAPSWQAKAAGIMLRSGATTAALPSSSAEVVFTDLSSEATDAARSAALSAGYDPRQVIAYGELPDIVPPVAYVGSALALTAVLLAAVTAVARAQATTLRPYLSGLVALGLPRRWAKHVLYREVAVLLALGALLGTAVAVLPLILATRTVDGLQFAIPWRQVGTLMALFLTMALLATGHASRNLRPVGRTGI